MVSQPLIVVMDPRIKTSTEDFTEQKLISQRLSDMMQADADALSQIRALSIAINSQANLNPPAAVKAELTSARQELDRLAGSSRRGEAGRSPESAPDLTALNRELGRVFEIVQGSDRAPTTQALSAVTELRKSLDAQLVIWKRFRTTRMEKLNSVLRDAQLPELTVPKVDLSRLKGSGSESFDADADEP